MRAETLDNSRYSKLLIPDSQSFKNLILLWQLKEDEWGVQNAWE
jgi:hypothetical protein